MAYGRGGIFRSRFIAPRAQRATEILSKPLISQVTLEFDAGAANLAGNFTTGQIVSLALTAQPAVGQERLVMVGGLSASTSADFTLCTIDGQVATRVGVISRGVGSGNRVFMTAFRAPGTGNTSINVVLTVGSAAGGINNIFASCWKMSYAGTLAAQVSSSANDPTLSVNTVAKGAVAGAEIGFGTGLFAGATDSFAWTGLTERYENHASSNIAFVSASADIAAASSPLAITVNITPDLTAGGTSKAGLTLSFNPLPAVSSVQAGAGFYTMTGQDPGLVLAHFAIAAPATYAMTGTAASPHSGRGIAAVPASYVMTGTAAVPNRSAGGTGAIVYDAYGTGGAKTNGQVYTFPLTVAPAPGERLVILAGLGDTLADLTTVTVDGQAATRVGALSRGRTAAGNSAAFITAYRATGTLNTSINVLATLSLPQAQPFYSAYCACLHMSGVGAMYQNTNSADLQPIALSTDTVDNGAVVAALLGYQATSISTVWTGLTERLDGTNSGAEVFSLATADTVVAATPRAISASITPALTDSDDSVASIALSFVPSGSAGTRLAANTGTYAMTGTAALTARGRNIAAVAGSYAMTGAPIAIVAKGKIAAESGAYAMTGRAAAMLRGGTNKRLDIVAGSYALTGTDASVAKGRKASVTTVGTYNLTGTTVVAGRGLIAVAASYALTGSAVTLTYRSGPNVSISVGSTGLTAFSGTAEARSTVGVLVSGLGNFATVSVGNASVATLGGMSVSATGNFATAFVGNATVSIGGGTAINVTAPGFFPDESMLMFLGNATVMIPARATIVGNIPMTASVGNVTVNTLGTVNEMIIGNQIVASVGEVTFRTNANVNVTGFTAMTASVGSVDTFILVGALASGNEMTASVGDVTVLAKQNTVVNVTGPGMVAYVGTLDFAGGGTITHPNLKNREGRMLQPSNFMGG